MDDTLGLGGEVGPGDDLRLGEVLGLELRGVGGSALGDGDADPVPSSGACAEGADGE